MWKSQDTPDSNSSPHVDRAILDRLLAQYKDTKDIERLADLIDPFVAMIITDSNLAALGSTKILEFETETESTWGALTVLYERLRKDASSSSQNAVRAERLLHFIADNVSVFNLPILFKTQSITAKQTLDKLLFEIRGHIQVDVLNLHDKSFWEALFNSDDALETITSYWGERIELFYPVFNPETKRYTTSKAGEALAQAVWSAASTLCDTSAFSTGSKKRSKYNTKVWESEMSDDDDVSETKSNVPSYPSFGGGAPPSLMMMMGSQSSSTSIPRFPPVGPYPNSGSGRPQLLRESNPLPSAASTVKARLSGFSMKSSPVHETLQQVSTESKSDDQLLLEKPLDKEHERLIEEREFCLKSKYPILFDFYQAMKVAALVERRQYEAMRASRMH